MTTHKNNLSKLANEYLTEFSEAFMDALVVTSETPSWAEKFGMIHTSDAPRTLFPIPLDSVGFKRFKGEMTYRRLYNRALDISPEPWYDGVEELKDVVESDAFIGWDKQPGKIALAWRQFKQVRVAEMLALSSYDGPLLALYKDRDSEAASTIRLFSDTHLINPLLPELGTFDNTTTCTVAEILSGAAYEAIETHFNSIIGPDGTRPLGLTFTDLLVPHGRRMTFKRSLEHDSIVRAVNAAGALNASSSNIAAVTQNNIFQSINYTSAHELLSNTYFYAFASLPDGSIPPAWVVQEASAPEEIICDTSDQKYKDTGLISIGYRGKAGAEGALPHAILRVAITG